MSTVNVANEFLEDKEWFKFGVVMTCCHYVIFRTYFDKLIEFSSNMKCSGVLKARILEELKATNLVTIFTTVTRFYDQRGMFLSCWNRDTISSSATRFLRKFWKDARVLMKSWRNFILLWRDFRRIQICLFKLKSIPNIRVTILESKSAILRPEDCWKADFIILYSVHVCFNYFIDYAICKLDYE